MVSYKKKYEEMTEFAKKYVDKYQDKKYKLKQCERKLSDLEEDYGELKTALDTNFIQTQTAVSFLKVEKECLETKLTNKEKYLTLMIIGLQAMDENTMEMSEFVLLCRGIYMLRDDNTADREDE